MRSVVGFEDARRPRLLVLRSGEHDGAVHRGKYAARVLEEDPAGREQRHASRRAGKEWGPDLVLERPNVPADGRLRHAEALRGAAHVALLRHYGYHGDTSATFVIGEATADAKRIVDVARRCRDVGIAVIRDGARPGDIGAAIVELARQEGVCVVTEVGGHGIGRHMHADPHVPHIGTRGAGARLKAGMAITVEPMVNLGGAAVRVLDDGWTIVTADGSLSAQWEHTVVVTREGHEITTLG